MSSFYKDLKDLRIESGIDLEEIHNRTKISLEALRAIESGQFDELPQTYIRLFVRAYANEIGADENSTLSELDKFLSKESKVGSQLESNKTYQQINVYHRIKYKKTDSILGHVSNFDCFWVICFLEIAC